MSAKTMGQVWDLDIPHNQLIVLLAMTDHADHNGGNMYPSMGLIAYKTGYSERQVKRIVKELVKVGLLVITKAGNGTVNTYCVDFSNAKKKEPYTRDKKSPLKSDTHDTTMSRGVGHNSVTPTHDIQMSPEPSIEPSNNHIDDPKVIAMPQAVMDEPKEATPNLTTGKSPEKKAAEYLADAMGIKLLSGSVDWSLYTKRANELIKAGIPMTEFAQYVARIKRQAAGKWNVTINSLVSNGRMSEYTTARDNHKLQQQQATKQELETEAFQAFLLQQLKDAS